jgi:voltage-dependent potassium channel beta subunit
MHYRRLGRSGLKVSEISLGSWVTFGNQIEEQLAIDLLHAAYDQGVNFFDNADVYANGQAETVMGRAIQGLPREALVISSKVFWPTMPGPNGRGLSRKHILESIHASLRRLGTDYLDLYFCHRFDQDTPVEEVVQTMDMLVRQGKVLYWGTSKWEAAQITQSIGIARQGGMIPPSIEQPKYNLFNRRHVEVELEHVVKEFGLGLTVFSPLENGLLSGKYNEAIPIGSRASMADMAWMRDQITPERIAIIRQLTGLAQSLGITTAQLAIAWVLRRKEVSSVITGATRLEQLDENLMASSAIDFLTDEVLDRIERISEKNPD